MLSVVCQAAAADLTGACFSFLFCLIGPGVIGPGTLRPGCDKPRSLYVVVCLLVNPVMNDPTLTGLPIYRVF